MAATKAISATRASAPLSLPSERQLVAELNAMAQKEEAIALAIQGLQSGAFHHPDGRTDELGLVRITMHQAGLLAHLAANCPKPLSVEVGFGMGTSAAVMLGARRLAGKPFAHVIYDPYGLGDGRGEIVQEYLQQRFPKAFRRIVKRSEIGLAQLIDRNGPGAAGLIFIDGGHQFENVMVDFVLADQLCCEGGYIVFDDASFPAIESTINYIMTNRPDYAVSHADMRNCAVLRKMGPDTRPWDAFSPFEIPDRHDWEAKPSESQESVVATEANATG